MAMNFVHLHAHSCYSLLEGSSEVGLLLQRAKERGMNALALTDSDGLYGAVPFFKKARALGVKPVLGSRITSPLGDAVCLARNRTGYANLCQIISDRKLLDDFDIVAELMQHQDGLCILTPSVPLIEKLAEKIQPSNLYVELIRYPLHNHSPAQTSGPQERAAEKFRLPVVATNASRFADAAQHYAHRVLTAIRRNGLLSDLQDDDTAHPEAWLKADYQMIALFHDRPDAIRNAITIADSCDLKLESDRPVFPTCELRDKETPFSRLWKLTFLGAARRYRPLTPAVIDRVKRELDVINKLGFAEYFLIVHDIVRFAHRSNIPTVGRGSAADSIVSYCLGITAVDPLEHDLCFERFLNMQRPDCPDIDIDFCWRRRDEVIDYVFKKYGAERVAMVANHNCFGARSAFRDVARVFGLPLEEVNRLSSVLPYHSVHSIREAMRQWPEMRDFPIDREPYRMILHIAEQIDRFPRHLSVHVGGMVIGDKPLTNYVPLERSAKGPVICQFDKDGVEAVGLVKIDILAQRSLSIISDTVRWVEKNRGRRIDLKAIPPDDAQTGELLARGGTMGCFQIESPGMRSLLQMMRAKNRRDVIIGLSLIRPGPSGSGMKERYVKRRLGQEPPVYLHPKLTETLADTFGVMLYQEDILRVAHAAAGFTLEEGDELRRAIKENPDAQKLEKLHMRFVAGARRNGGEIRQIEELWTLINNFAAYSYCKAHATTYGYISYQASYLKARYPVEFLAAVLANQAGFYEQREYIEEARRLGVKILPPDANRSEMNFCATPEGIRVPLMQVRELSLRSIQSILAAREQLPFASLEDFIERTTLCRAEAENLALCGALDCFSGNRPQLLWQVRLLFKQLSQLRRNPTFDSFGLFGDATTQGPETGGRRPVTTSLKETHNQQSSNPGSSVLSVSSVAKNRSIQNPTCPPRRKSKISAPSLPDYTLSEKLLLEQELLGLTVSAHPLVAYEEQIRQVPHVPANKLHLFAGKRVTVIGWLVTMRRAVTKNQEYMKFVTLEDLTGPFEAVFFPDTYQKFGRLITGYGPYIVRGKVEHHNNSVALTAESISLLRRENFTRPRFPSAAVVR